ncbi:MAG TPA: glycerol-3-phosphate dehydrogenase/oxidase [Terriglobales bacterium]|nr:glycerol-3-phosphate dehydrogenase/oxidase [Terriglobales bacterium]
MKNRKQARKAIEERGFDLCVIGGGATGAGCALDAQLRGLRTVMLDAGDFASAASSASTKLVHGGVRYLEQAVKRLNLEEYRMVQNALKERVYMLTNAPHLAHAAEFMVPIYSWSQAAYYRAGMKMYDWLSGKHSLFPSRYVSREETLHRMPGLRREGLRGAVAYSDGQFDDARYDMSLVKTFARARGEALNYARVTGFSRGTSGKLDAASVRDELAKEEFTVKARAFVNATGPASDAVREMASPGTAKRMRPSKGVHILFPLEAFPSEDALLVPRTEDGRLIFAVPWLGRLLVGTTDEEATPQTRMIVLREEAEYLFRQLNPYLSKPLGSEQIVSGLSGLRPLVAAGNGPDTKELIRDHEVESDMASGLISILGGKWTTHRLMAEDTIDAVQKAMGEPLSPCLTKQHVLAGAEGYAEDYWKQLRDGFCIEEGTAKHLAEKFGTEAERVLRLCEGRKEWKEPLVEGMPAIRAQAVFCIREEMAMTIEDVLARRIGIQFFDWRKAIEAAPIAADLLADELGWSEDEEAEAVKSYTAKIQDFLRELGLAGAG